jgi:two-component system phosphate regulon response regulator PhoB
MKAIEAHDQPVILLVQPEHDDREMYAEFLRHEGFASLPVSTASDALIVAPYVAVIVTGMLLPGRMGGLEFIGRLKSDERTRSVPVVVLTACAWDTERERAQAAGCDLFLTKPCLPHVLVAEIRRLLSMRLPSPRAERGSAAARRPAPARSRLMICAMSGRARSRDGFPAQARGCPAHSHARATIPTGA